MTSIGLSHIPLADNHCHGIYHTQGPMDAPAWRRLFTESGDPRMRSEHVATTLFYHRLVRKMATFFGCDPTEYAVLEARRQFDYLGLTGKLLRAALIAVLFLDKSHHINALLFTADDVLRI